MVAVTVIGHEKFTGYQFKGKPDSINLAIKYIDISRV